MQKITDVVIFGIGAAGSNIFCELLVTSPSYNFTVVDFDKVEPRNIEAGTQRYTKSDLNRPKTQSIQRMAMQHYRKRVTAFDQKVESVEDITTIVPDPQSTVLVDAFDNARGRNLFLELPPDYHVLHVGFSPGLSGEDVWEYVFTAMAESEADNKIDICKQQHASLFIMALTCIATKHIQLFAEEGEKWNSFVNWHPLMTREYR